MDKDFESLRSAIQAGYQYLRDDDNEHVNMLAVVKLPRKSDFELRTILISGTSDMKTLDDALLYDALKPYALDGNEVQYLPFELSLDVKNSIGVLDIDAVSQDNPPEQGGLRPPEKLIHFVQSIQKIPDQPIDQNVDALKDAEFEMTVGILFIYTCLPDRKLFAYQRLTGSSHLKQRSILLSLSDKMFNPKNTSFKLVNNNALNIAHKFDFLILENNLVIMNHQVLEVQFGYRAVLQNRAKAIVNSQLSRYLSDSTFIDERLSGNAAQLIRRINRLSDSPVLRMSPTELHAALEGVEDYKGKFKFDDDGLIIVKSAEDVDEALKMFNDSRVRSPLTNATYDSEVKQLIR